MFFLEILPVADGTRLEVIVAEEVAELVDEGPGLFLGEALGLEAGQEGERVEVSHRGWFSMEKDSLEGTGVL